MTSHPNDRGKGEFKTHGTDRAQSDLERLLERITSGTIEDVDELPPQDLDLLRSYYGEGEDLQDVLDRLRSGGEEGA
ncbi:MAG: hypothetical protein R3F56_10200 [Planctomycetota bacterium]